VALQQDAARQSFDDFVRTESAALIRSANLLTGDRHHAEDLVQTALARAVTRWHQIDEPRAYVYRVLHTEFVNWWRRRRVRVAETLTGDVPERQAPAGPDPELAVVLRQALARLTPRQRTVLVLRFYEDHSEAETAARLGCPIGTVKSQTRHALDRLRRLAPELAELVDPKAEARS
jgi:RNA polymerase sigma-70 factor (sigma-E family)